MVPPHLTRRQQEIYDYLRKHLPKMPHPPTLDELCDALGLRSRGSMHKHVAALIDAGLVERHARETYSRKARQILADWSTERLNFLQVCPKEMLIHLPQPLSGDAEAVPAE